MANKSKIGNVEWGLVLGATATVDTIQVFLTPFLVPNRLIDIVMGMSLVLYFLMRGVKLSKNRILALCLSFLIEEIPLLDALPAWSGDVIYTWMSVRAEEKL
ncbi:MAG: hypothetical protein NUV47_01510 [Patescibacteria group bacterium]|nr:hypothetical protein [Patescibacteria group bacterium]